MKVRISIRKHRWKRYIPIWWRLGQWEIEVDWFKTWSLITEWGRGGSWTILISSDLSTCGNNLPLELSALDWVGLVIGFLLVKDESKNTGEFFVNFCTGSVGEKYVVFSLTLPWSKKTVSVHLLLDNGLQSCQKLSRHPVKVYAPWYRSCHISHGWKASYRWAFHP